MTTIRQAAPMRQGPHAIGLVEATVRDGIARFAEIRVEAKARPEDHRDAATLAWAFDQSDRDRLGDAL